MPPLANSIVLVCLAVSSVLAIWSLLRSRAVGRFLVELGLLLTAGVTLFATTGFPRPAVRQSFGTGAESLLVVALMFLCIVLGMAARYLFYLRGPFSWLSFLKPLCVSPIVLLPILGTLQPTAELAPVQLVSFCLLAFQNGFFWRVVFETSRSKLGRAGARAIVVVMLGLLAARAEAAAPPDVPARYAQFFAHYVDRRSLPEKALNLVGLSSADLGRSFALVAGVDTYPNLPWQNRSLAPAAIDLQNLVRYLRDVESFDEIVFLHNDAVTDENFKYFLQAYFPDRLRKFPHSRFLFAYSGHGIQEGSRGYLLQSAASSFDDKANSISLEVLRTLYDEIVDSAYQSLALINACHSGAFERRSFGSERRLLPREPGAHVITAGGSREQVWHDPRVGPGSIFFEKFFAGLDGRADSQPLQKDGSRGDGIITVPELFAYLATEIQLETNQAQNPEASDISRNGEGGSFFFLSRTRQVTAGLMHPWEPKRGFGADAGPAPDDLAARAQAAFDKGAVAEAVKGFQEACAGGSNRGCALLGRMYRLGLGGPAVDQKKAVELFRTACERGDAVGCNGLGVSYEYGEGGLSPNVRLAVELYRKSCDQQEGHACANLANSYLAGGGGLAVDAKAAVEIQRKACAEAGAPACTGLGLSYQDGKGGLAKDEKKAVELYQKACQGGDAEGCFFLGLGYELGQGGLAADARKAVALYRSACERGNGSGCNGLGVAHDVGRGGLAGDPKVAVDFYRKACAWHSAEGCYREAFAYDNPKGRLPGDARAAVELYQRACELGSPDACANLGFKYDNGQGGLAANPGAAAQLYRKACDGGSAAGCFSLALDYDHGTGGVATDLNMAASLYQRACDAGDAGACSNLGLVYSKGFGKVPADLKAAARLYRKACNGGNAGGCSNLGVLYKNGWGGLAVDSVSAVKLFRKACDGGTAKGCFNLGAAYDFGTDGLATDKGMAAQLYRKACDAGDRLACVNLGVLYKNGEGGLAADPKMAVQLNRKACDAGEPSGCLNLGVYFENGEGGLTRDTRKAAELYRKACDRGIQDGCTWLKALQGHP